MSADFCSPPAGSTHKRMSGGGKWKSAEFKRKTVMLIYPDPKCAAPLASYSFNKARSITNSILNINSAFIGD